MIKNLARPHTVIPVRCIRRAYNFWGELGLAEEIVELGRRVDTIGFYDGNRRRAEIRRSCMNRAPQIC